MKPFFFGPPSRQLFGIFHDAICGGAAQGAVLVCGPFGQEAIQAHRILRALATRLGKVGYQALRFNYFATGDSAGECEEGSQSQWVADVHAAHLELVRLSGASRIAWVGLRYGASLATLAASSIPSDLSELVLWDPVVHGSAYLTELSESHAAFMQADLPGWKAPLSQTEALGFPISASLAADFRALDLTANGAVRARHVTLVRSQPETSFADFERSLAGSGVSSESVLIDTGATWKSEEAMNTFYVPVNVLNAVVSRIQGAP